ncbi:MAG TPA: S41 family peptidase, partial [Candidatus Kapabacteria bacterium]|nr:S41 family peptidase [Candidatus Kapabacteria bacterium]
NPGGYLDQAYKVADDFIPGGRKIVYTRGRTPDLGFDEEYNSTPGGIAENIPLILLVDKYSASASEIVSGAIQDNDRGLIVGTRTFGKGLVQRQFTMADGSGVRITIARYYTPSGRLIQRPYEKGETAKYYAALQSRKDLPEGDNISHTEDKSDSSKAYHTIGGRVVYGGGGITPDYIIDPDTLSQLEKDLWSKNTYTEFVDSWMGSHRNELTKEYKTFQQFKDNFKVSSTLQQEFIDFAKSNKKIEFTSEQFNQDKDLIQSQLCGYIARNIWNFDGFYDVVLQGDNQFQKAITLFPEAIKIAHLESMR